MNYRLIKYIGIKYFPSRFLDYVIHFFFNLLFSIIFILNIPFIKSLLYSNHKPSYILLIPTIDPQFEEKKDMIFSSLSLNTNIISVREIDKNIVQEKLSKKTNLKLFEEDLIPEVFEIVLQNNKSLDLNKENTKLKRVFQAAEILKKKVDYKAINITNYLSLGVAVALFFSILIKMQLEFVDKIKIFIKKSRMFGVKDINLIFYIGIGYTLLQFLGTLAGYLLIYYIEKKFKFAMFLSINHLEIIIFLVVLQNFISLINFVILIKYVLKKVL